MSVSQVAQSGQLSVMEPLVVDNETKATVYVSNVGEFPYRIEWKNVTTRLRLQSVIREKVTQQGVSWSFGCIVRYVSNGKEPDQFSVPLEEAFYTMATDGQFHVSEKNNPRDPLRLHGDSTGWTPDLCNRFVQVARRWHLNDMRNECEHQREWDWESCSGHYSGERVTIPYIIPNTDWDNMTRRMYPGECRDNTGGNWSNQNRLRARKYILNPKTVYFESGRHYWWTGPEQNTVVYCHDMSEQPCPICGYRFRGPWMYERPPQEVVAFVDSIKAMSVVTDRSY